MQIRRLVLALTLMAAALPGAYAQRITGVVRDTASSEPLAGVVVSLLDSLRSPVSRTLTDAAGRYSVLRPANAPFMRVMRIGYQPRLFALPPRLESADVVDVTMKRVATLLSTVVVNDDRVCSEDKDRTSALSLWEQARAGLLTAVVAREQMPANASFMSYERTLDAGNGKLLRQTSQRVTGTTTRPFRAGESPSELARRGYLRASPEGEFVLAPDADVLLDDSFASTHCFSVRPADPAHPGLVGLAFEPVKGRDTLVDVRGTLWLESGVPSLRSLDFQYTGKRTQGDLRDADGTMLFRAMPNGVVFIENWQLRLPVLQRRFNGRAGLTTRLVQRSESGGIVLSAKWNDGSHWANALPPLTGVVRERNSTLPIMGALVTLETTSDTVVTDSAGKYVIHPVLPGRYVVLAADTSLSLFVKARSTSREIDVVRGRAPVANLELPGPGESMKQLCDGVTSRGTTSMIVGRVRDVVPGVIPRDVRLTARWLYTRGLTPGTVADAKTEYETVDPDEQGRFSFCALPRDQTIRITASRPGIEYADTLVVVDPSAPILSVEWRLDLRTLALLLPPKPTVLRGRVVRAGSTAPVPGAEVWLPALDRRATTDSAGEFRLDSLRGGAHHVQVRRVGFAVVRDTLTIAPETEVRREFTLIASSQVLDTIRTVASAVRYSSPLLRGFEERRANHASGYFITDSTLRRSDNSNVGNVVVSRVAGIALVPGRGAATHLVTTRKACRGSVMSCTGVSNCYVTIYLDGILYFSATAAVPPPDVSRFMVNQFAAIEFYPSAGTGPPQYNATGSGCGTLLLWTREG